MIVDVSMKILIVGLGLLGGSYARGLKRFGFRIGAITKEQKDIDYALRDRIQDMLREDVEFIAAHPMAGREVSGVENSTEKMFIGANYIVTPTAKNTPEAIQTCVEIGRLLGFPASPRCPRRSMTR